MKCCSVSRKIDFNRKFQAFPRRLYIVCCNFLAVKRGPWIIWCTQHYSLSEKTLLKKLHCLWTGYIQGSLSLVFNCFSNCEILNENLDQEKYTVEQIDYTHSQSMLKISFTTSIGELPWRPFTEEDSWLLAGCRNSLSLSCPMLWSQRLSKTTRAV